MSGKFPCTSCGACCRRVRGIDPNWPVGSDGKSCIHLNEDNSCAIYENRPRICRVNELKPPRMTLEDWYNLNAAACNYMMDEDGLPEGLRLPTDSPETA